MNKNLLLLFLASSFSMAEKVLIFTTAFNRPDFIEIHKKTFDKFMKDEFEYVVFSDANKPDMANKIATTCKNLGIRHFPIPQDLHTRSDAGSRHIDGITYAFKQLGFKHDGIVMLIDSDMFLIKPFCATEYLKGYHIAGDKEGRNESGISVEYISPLVVLINMNSAPNKEQINFNGGIVEGNRCDVGGHMYYYFKNNPTVSIKYFGHIHIGAWKMGIECNDCSNMSCSNCMQRLHAAKFDDHLIRFIHECPDDIEFSMNHTFLHYRSGSNWNNKPTTYHTRKTNALSNLLSTIL